MICASNIYYHINISATRYNIIKHVTTHILGPRHDFYFFTDHLPMNLHAREHHIVRSE